MKPTAWLTAPAPTAGVAAMALAGLAANALALAPLPSWVVALAGLMLWCALPGWLLASLWLPGADRHGDGAGGSCAQRTGAAGLAHTSCARGAAACHDALERTAFAAGAGSALLVLGGTALHFVPGPITPLRVLLAGDLMLLVLLAVVARRGTPLRAPRPSREVMVQVALLLLLAAALRLPNLGYAEFQGDEAAVMLKAAAAVDGRADALFVHKKGPAEIVVTAVLFGLSKTTSETAARLPFALAMIAGLLTLYQLGRALFGPHVAFVAAVLLCLNGFFVAFGRIVQYQAFVFLFSTLAVLAAWRTRSGLLARRHLAATVVLLAVGLLAHYDALFALPPVLYAWWLRWRERPEARRGDGKVVAAAGAAAALLLAAFYSALMAHPYFREATLPYLFDVRLAGPGDAGGVLHNALGTSRALATFYNSTYFMALLAVALLAFLARSVVRSRPGPAGRAMAAALILAGALLVARPEAWSLGGVNLALPVLVLGLGGVLAGRAPTAQERLCLAWFAVGFVAYATLVSSPRTHFHVAFPAWSLLGAVALVQGLGVLGTRRARRAAALALTGFLAVSAVYVVDVFVRHDVEYRRRYPEVRPFGFWMSGEALPANGWFGFPYRVGWKAVGELYAVGRMSGTYDSNEEENVTTWYTRGAPRCGDDARYLIVARDVQDEREISPDPESLGYRHSARIVADGRERLDVYERSALPPAGAGRAGPDMPVDAGAGAPAEPQTEPGADVETLRLEDHADGFDAIATARFEPGLPFGRSLPHLVDAGDQRPPYRVGADYAGLARLEAWACDGEPIAPGGELVVRLYWRGTATMARDYSVFAHLVPAVGNDVAVAQSDGAPGWCGDAAPTTTWAPGRVVLDRRLLRVPGGTSPGEYAVRVGLYDYETLERLPVRQPGAKPGADQTTLGPIRVEADGP